jgi:hypothetical protein
MVLINKMIIKRSEDIGVIAIDIVTVEKRRRLRYWPESRIGNSLFWPTNSLFGQKNSLFPEEQGIGCKLLSPLGDWLSKPSKEAGIVRNFRKIPCYFPCSQGMRG